MDNRDALRSMINNFINNKTAEAELDLHGYFVNKMKDVAGLGSAPAAEVPAGEAPAVVAPEGEAAVVADPAAPTEVPVEAPAVAAAAQ